MGSKVGNYSEDAVGETERNTLKWGRAVTSEKNG